MSIAKIKRNMLKNIINKCRWIPAFLLVLTFCGCEGWFGKNRKREYDDVLIYYAAGYNSLSSFLKGDFNDLKKGYIPRDANGEDVLIAYVHVKTSDPSPVLLRLYRDRHDKLVTDTLAVYDKSTISSSAAQLGKVLSSVNEKFPAKRYGMIFSSHSTGYLPAGYYTGSKEYEADRMARTGVPPVSGDLNPVPYREPDYGPDSPLTKSIGQDAVGNLSYEMELSEFASAIPMYMEYIMFDTCLMGGIEVAYELKDICGKIGFSQAEVLAEGFDYTKLTRHLFLNDVPRPEKVCEDYFLYYDAQTGLERSATISCVDCSRLGSLAQVCSGLFSKYADSISQVDPGKVQRYFRSNYHWFYDLKSILVEAGIDAAELKSLEDALNECIIYKAATPSFIGSFDIEVFSGFSMFLPSNGGARLKEFYRTLEWNMDTGLVR